MQCEREACHVKIHRAAPLPVATDHAVSVCGRCHVTWDNDIVSPYVFGWLPRSAQCGNCLRRPVYCVDGLPNGQQSSRPEHHVEIEVAIDMLRRVFMLECAEWRSTDRQWRDMVLVEYDRQMDACP